MSTKELSKLTKPELIKLASELNITINEESPKAVIFDTINAFITKESELELEDETNVEFTGDPESSEEPAEEVETIQVNKTEVSPLKTAMSLELAKRSAKANVGSSESSTTALKSELARRAARFGSGVVSTPSDVSSALKQEIARRQVKGNK